jgi:hypothetical protein
MFYRGLYVLYTYIFHPRLYRQSGHVMPNARKRRERKKNRDLSRLLPSYPTTVTMASGISSSNRAWFLNTAWIGSVFGRGIQCSQMLADGSLCHTVNSRTSWPLLSNTVEEAPDEVLVLNIKCNTCKQVLLILSRDDYDIWEKGTP